MLVPKGVAAVFESKCANFLGFLFAVETIHFNQQSEYQNFEWNEDDSCCWLKSYEIKIPVALLTVNTGHVEDGPCSLRVEGQKSELRNHNPEWIVFVFYAIGIIQYYLKC